MTDVINWHLYLILSGDAGVRVKQFEDVNRSNTCPPFARTGPLVPLVSFLTNLVQAVRRFCLGNAQKLKNPNILILDQSTEDLKVKLGFTCTFITQYEAFLVLNTCGNWKLPPCISEDHDSVILSLTFSSKFISWKLKSGAKELCFKETDFNEAQ